MENSDVPIVFEAENIYPPVKECVPGAAELKNNNVAELVIILFINILLILKRL